MSLSLHIARLLTLGISATSHTYLHWSCLPHRTRTYVGEFGDIETLEGNVALFQQLDRICTHTHTHTRTQTHTNTHRQEGVGGERQSCPPRHSQIHKRVPDRRSNSQANPNPNLNPNTNPTLTLTTNP